MIGYLTRFKDIATSPYGDTWRRMRRLGLLHIAAPKQIAAWADVRRGEVQRMVAGIAAAAETEGGREGLVLRPLLFTATLNNIMMVCAGRRWVEGREGGGGGDGHGVAGSGGENLRTMRWALKFWRRAARSEASARMSLVPCGA